ncbi:M56 family metallopeptidase [Sphingopyxis sp. MWB1]|uniref:M56 family metallopeptidase n=1 Tax=Sphingopyxis sp. MWB1 TaxID=1537715 RepID=UPI000519F0C9|nr:M56 family metallopeptidase [Sphingopyxis sp. MWB1]
MSAALALEAWGDTLISTGLILIAILLIRKPFTRLFGARLAYALWLVPLLRLILPPLPLAPPVVELSPIAEELAAADWAAMKADIPTDGSAFAASAPASLVAEPLMPLAELMPALMPMLFGAWLVGAAAVLFAAVRAHMRFRETVLREAVELEPIGSVRLAMSDAVDGPVAFGLIQRHVVVPQNFFGRYAAAERALAIDHELAHHRHGDLWANAAALVVLATQWFNPFAWRAIRAFRFDQEAACDARVLGMEGPVADGLAERRERTVQYATAIAKAATGARLSLAAPMAMNDNLQERLSMLMEDEISPRRGLIGRVLLGGVALTALATTATLTPSGAIAADGRASEWQATAEAASSVEPLAAEMEALSAEMTAPDMAAALATAETARAAGEKLREAGFDAVRAAGEQSRVAALAAVKAARAAERAGVAPHKVLNLDVSEGASRQEMIAALREKGLTAAKAEKVADGLEARSKYRAYVRMAHLPAVHVPSPPVPPVPPVPEAPPVPPAALEGLSRSAMVVSGCSKEGEITLRQKQSETGKDRRVHKVKCGPGVRTITVAALRETRDQLARQKGQILAHGLSHEMRAEIQADIQRAVAELDRAIAEAERETH